MKSFSVLCYAVCAVTVIGSTRCEPAEDEASTDKAPQANRRSYGEYHGLYAPAYHAHYGAATYHGHYAPAAHYHAHSYAAPAHYHGHSYAPAHYHSHGYAPAHYHHHETSVHGFKHQPIVYQSVVHTYPTATTVVHKPVPVPVAHPVPVPVVRPVAVEVSRPYPVAVNRPYPVTVIKPVAVPVAQPYPVTVYKPYPVPVYRPLPVATVARPTSTAVHYVTRLPTVRAPLVRYPAPSYLQHSHTYAPHYHGAVAYQGSTSYQGPTAYQGQSSYLQGSTAYQGQSSYLQGSTAYQGAYPAEAQSTYLHQLAALRAAGGNYEVNEAAAQQQTLQDEYSYLQEQRDVGATDIHHHHHEDDAHHHVHDHGVIDQDGVLGSGAGYPSLTADETFKTSLGVPSTDYTGKKK